MKEGASRSFSFIEPMNALPVQKLPEGDWLYEVKFDGYRFPGTLCAVITKRALQATPLSENAFQLSLKGGISLGLADRNRSHHSCYRVLHN